MTAFLELHQLSKYYGEKAAVQNITLSLTKGDLLALVGESGSGKTTLLKLMACFLEPTIGELYLEGEKLLFYAQYLVKGHPQIRLVAQDFQLFPNISLRENIKYALRTYTATYQNERADELVALCGIEAIQYQLPKEVSGGEKQRTAIARAVAEEPSILLLDEPFSQLDTLNKNRLKNFLVNLNKQEQTTIVFVTHDLLDAFTVGQSVAVLQHGKLVQHAKPDALIANPATPYIQLLVESLKQQVSEVAKLLSVVPNRSSS
ncbi:MAG: ATP-binding cassette domain-containing protein [Spirosomataceae bacterium]